MALRQPDRGGRPADAQSPVWGQRAGMDLGDIGLIVTALVSALYPAIRAARVPPADTLSGL